MKQFAKVLWAILLTCLFLPGLSAEAVDKNTLVVASPFDFKSADPYMASGETWHMAPLWSDRLFGRDLRTGEIKPHLAESWEQRDSLTLEVRLCKGIKFHNGERLDANAVKNTLEWY